MKKLLLPAKIFVSVTLIVYLLYSIEWADAHKLIIHANWLLLALAFVLMAVQFPISVYKWNIALKSHGLEYPFHYLFKVLSIGFFFNNFLPTSIGGDAYRVIKTIPRDGNRKSRSLSAVLLERVVGFIALLTIGFIGSIYLIFIEPFQAPIYFAWAFCAGLFVVALLWLVQQSNFYKKFVAYMRSIKKLEILFSNYDCLMDNKQLLIILFSASFFFQLVALVSLVALFGAIEIDGVAAKCAFLAAVVGLVSVLPISINGIGVVESSFVLAAGWVGIGFTEATFVAVALRLLVIPLSVACGVYYAVDSKNR